MSIPVAVNELRVARLLFVFPTLTGLALEVVILGYGNYDDDRLARICAARFDPLHFRTILTALLDDITLRGANVHEVLQAQFYNIIAETGVAPAYLEELING
jgi:hypothetical protein